MAKVTIQGWLGKREVSAVWEDGTVTGDKELLLQAREFARTADVASVGHPYAAASPGLREPYSFAMTLGAVLGGNFTTEGLEPFLPPNDPELYQPGATP